MQTFLPYPNFAASARCLDRQRLGKQRVECAQLLKAILHGGGWSNHPCARMWEGFEFALWDYQSKCIDEWVRRGYVNNIPVMYVDSKYDVPPWLGDPEFHASHRSNLLRKSPGHYGQFGWTEPPDLPYVWPT